MIPKSHFNLLLALSLFFLSFLAYIYVTQQYQIQLLQYQLLKLQSPTSVPSPIPTATSTTQTYKNDKYNFEINYPTEFSKLETSPEYVRFFKGNYDPSLPSPETYVSIQIKSNPAFKTLKQWLLDEKIVPQQNDISSHIIESEININNITGIKISTPVNGGQDTVYFSQGKNIIQLTYVFMGENPDDYNQFLSTYNQILSTFKFTN